VAKQPKGELVVIGFNYDLLDTKLADKVRTAAGRIRDRIKKTVEDIIEVGNDLLSVKEALRTVNSYRGSRRSSAGASGRPRTS
jgi:RNase H-fold protein (predicted Holliday junction resolvase)